jgi:hypothetical protein
VIRAVDDTKHCGKCDQLRPVSEFYASRNRYDGLSVQCKECTKQRHRRNYESKKLEIREAQKLRARAIRELPHDHPLQIARRVRLRDWYLRNQPRIAKKNRDGWLSRRYGMTSADVDAMLKEQGGGCAICGLAEFGTGTDMPNVDHCHATGVVRGILCGPCNRGLGAFADDIGRMERGIEYLRRSKKQKP